MSEQSESNPKRTILPDATFSPPMLAILIVPYSATLASLYLASYWKPLGVNPFHYANAADLTSATLGSLVATIGISTILFFIAAIVAPDPTSVPPFEPKTKFFKAVKKSEKYVFPAVLIFVVVRSLLTSDPFFWLYIGILLALWAFLHFGKQSFYLELFPTKWAFYSAPWILIAVPFFFYALGGYSIKQAIDPKYGSTIDLSRSNLNTAMKGDAMYAGMLGRHHAIYEVGTKSTILIPEGSTIVLNEKRYRQKRKSKKAEPAKK